MSNGSRAGKAYVELGIQNNLRRGLAQAEGTLKSWGSKLAIAGSIVTGAAGAGLGVFAGMAKSFADAGSQVYDMSKKTGVSAESLGALKYAADQSGTSLESVAKSMGALNRFTGALASGSSGAKDTLKALGISMSAFMAASPEGRLGLIADALNGIQDEGVRAAMAMKVLGKSGADLLPMLEGGSAGLSMLTDRARKMGWVLSNEDAKAADDLGDSFADLKTGFMAIVNQIGAAVAPMFLFVSKVMVGATKIVIDYIKTHRGLITALAMAFVAIGIVGSALLLLSGVLATGAFMLWMYNTALGIYAAICTAATAITAAFTAAMAMLQLVLTPVNLAILLITISLASLVVLIPALIVALFRMTDLGGTAFEEFGNKISSAFETAKTGLKAFADAMAAGDMAGAAKVAGATFHAVWAKVVLAIQKMFYELSQYITNKMYDAIQAVNKALMMARVAAASVSTTFSSDKEKAAAILAASNKGTAQISATENQRRAANKAYEAIKTGLDMATGSVDSEFQKTIEQVAKDRADKEAEKKKGFGMEMPEMETIKKAFAGGAFNASAARSLGQTPSSLLERQVKEQEKMNKTLEKMNAKLGEMGLEWGS